MTDDSYLIQRIKEGNHSAFRSLYDSHVSSLYRFLRQFARDEQETEEWVQRTFIKAYEQIHTFRGHSRLSTWLFTIGLNEMRSDRRRASVLPFEPVEESSPHPEDDTAQAFLWEDLMRGWLNELDEVKRAVFLLSEVEGYSHAEIAEMLNIHESNSRTILTRTKRWLRDQWNEERKTGS